MKKAIIAIAAVCVILACVLILQSRNTAQTETAQTTETTSTIETAAPETTGEPSAEEESTEETAATATLNYDNVYALHAPDDVIMTIDGKDVPWDLYAYWLYYSVYSIQSTFNYYYGMEVDWNSEIEEGVTFGDYAKQGAESYIKQIYAIEKVAEDNDIALSQEQEDELKTQYEEDIVSYCGEGATEQDFEEYLGQMYMTVSVYNRINHMTKLYNILTSTLYGENGEKLTDKEAIAYLNDNGYMYAAHILLPTINLETNDALDDDKIAAAKEKAEELSAELQAIEDTDERLAKFYEYMNEYSEDTGKTLYPDGYLFQSGDMVTEFEDAVTALKEYEVSDAVLSTYGYHVIIRLPLNANAVVSYDTNANPQYIKATIAAENVSNMISDCMQNAEVKDLAELSSLNLGDYVA